MKHKQSISKAVKWPTPSVCMVYYTCWILHDARYLLYIPTIIITHYVLWSLSAHLYKQQTQYMWAVVIYIHDCGPWLGFQSLSEANGSILCSSEGLLHSVPSLKPVPYKCDHFYHIIISNPSTAVAGHCCKCSMCSLLPPTASPSSILWCMVFSCWTACALLPIIVELINSIDPGTWDSLETNLERLACVWWWLLSFSVCVHVYERILAITTPPT